MSDYLPNRARTVIPRLTRDAGPCKSARTPDRGAGSTSVERSPAEVDALVARQRATSALPAFAVGARARLLSLARELEDTSTARSERISRVSRRRLERHISARREVEQLLAIATRLHARMRERREQRGGGGSHARGTDVARRPLAEPVSRAKGQPPRRRSRAGISGASTQASVTLLAQPHRARL
jgi:hypothetical protein